MESIWLVTALVLLQVAFISTKKNYHPYYMQDHCGKILYLDETKVADVYLTSKFAYEPRSCNFTVKTGITNHQVQAQIIQVDTSHQEWTSCQTSDNLQLYSANVDGNRLLTADGVCGTEVNAPNDMIESDDSSLLLAFTSQGKTDVPYRGFHIRITEFNPAECQPDDFMCGNGKCIKRFLTCDDADNCGDKTDETRDMAGCKLSRGHSKRDVNSNDVITEKDINDITRAHPELGRATVMDSNNKTDTNHGLGATAPKFTNTILMIVGVTVGSVLIIISVVACIVNRRLKTDRVDIARSSFTWSQTNAPTIESQAFGY